MSRSFLVSMALSLATASLAWGQSNFGGVIAPPEIPVQVFAPSEPSEPAVAVTGSKVWFRLEYLLWWLRSSPATTPLIVSGSNGDPVPGALDQPGTVPFHDSSLHFGNTSGLRLTAGAPIGRTFGVEGSYFWLERRGNGFSASATADDMAVIARPVFNPVTGAEGAYASAFPGSVTGGSSVYGQSQLQGYDLNLTATVFRCPAVRVDALAGFRSLYLNERLTISDTLVPVVPDFVTFNGVGVDAFTPVFDVDRFRTHNAFYGGQLGGRVVWQEDHFSISLLGKVAFGGTQQLVFIDGATVMAPPGGPPVATVGGILAQPSNIGRWYHTTFSVVPEAGVDIGYQFTPWLRASVGYTFTLWTGVVRPGGQIDRVVNPSQVPIDPTFGTGGGPNRPAPPSFHDTGFWAQGVSFGLMFTY